MQKPHSPEKVKDNLIKHRDLVAGGLTPKAAEEKLGLYQGYISYHRPKHTHLFKTDVLERVKRKYNKRVKVEPFEIKTQPPSKLMVVMGSVDEIAELMKRVH